MLPLNGKVNIVGNQFDSVTQLVGIKRRPVFDGSVQVFCQNTMEGSIKRDVRAVQYACPRGRGLPGALLAPRAATRA